MSRPLPAHGTPARYQHGCHCQPCRGAMSARRRNRYKAIAYGRWQPYGDVDQVRTHLRRLLNHHTLPQIVDLTGVSYAALRRILTDSPDRCATQRVQAKTADRILAASPQPQPTRTWVFVPAAGTVRRLQALALAGWPLTEISDRCGISANTLRGVRASGRQLVRYRTAAAVTKAFTDLWNLDPARAGVPARTAAIVRGVARSAGYVSALAWDDLDDPDAVPNVGGTSKPSAADRLEDFDWLTRTGVTGDQAASRLGVSLETIEKYRGRLRRREAATVLDLDAEAS